IAPGAFCGDEGRHERTGMEDDLSRLVDALPGLIWIAGRDALLHFANQRWYDYTGQTPAVAAGLGWRGAVHPDDWPQLWERWQSMAASGVDIELEARVRRHDGVYRWFSLRTSALPKDSGGAPRWCGICSDIDDRKRAETEL